MGMSTRKSLMNLAKDIASDMLDSEEGMTGIDIHIIETPMGSGAEIYGGRDDVPTVVVEGFSTTHAIYNALAFLQMETEIEMGTKPDDLVEC